MDAVYYNVERFKVTPLGGSSATFGSGHRIEAAGANVFGVVPVFLEATNDDGESLEEPFLVTLESDAPSKYSSNVTQENEDARVIAGPIDEVVVDFEAAYVPNAAGTIDTYTKLFNATWVSWRDVVEGRVERPFWMIFEKTSKVGARKLALAELKNPAEENVQPVLRDASIVRADIRLNISIVPVGSRVAVAVRGALAPEASGGGASKTGVQVHEFEKVSPGSPPAPPSPPSPKTCADLPVGALCDREPGCVSIERTCVITPPPFPPPLGPTSPPLSPPKSPPPSFMPRPPPSPSPPPSPPSPPLPPPF